MMTLSFDLIPPSLLRHYRHQIAALRPRLMTKIYVVRPMLKLCAQMYMTLAVYSLW